MKKSLLLWVVSGIIVLYNLVTYTTGWGGYTFQLYSSNILPVACALLAIVVLSFTFDRFKRWDYAKYSWLMILVGIVLYMMGELTYAILAVFHNIDMNETFPSAADYFWCLGYIPLFIGLVIMLIGYRRGGFPMGKTKIYILIFFALVLLLVLITYFILLPIYRDTSTDALAKFFYLFYPIADVLLLVPAVILMYITSLFGRGVVSKPWKYLVYGFILFTLADLAYSYLNWRDLYNAYEIIDVAWNAGYLLVGLAAVYQLELVDTLKGRDE